jgi:O-antigen/teichoic acid export membrane protein
MATLQDDKAALKSVYLQTLRMTSSVNFPIYAALAIFSHEVVIIVLGNRWSGASEFLRIFAVWGMIRSVTNPLGSLLYSTGHVKRAFWWNFVMAIILPGVLWLGARAGGTHGLAITMLFVQVIIFYPLYRLLVRPACGASFREYTMQLTTPLASTLIAAAMSLFAATRLQTPWSLVAGAAVFGIVYLVASVWINRPWMRAMQELTSPLFKFLPGWRG